MITNLATEVYQAPASCSFWPQTDFMGTKIEVFQGNDDWVTLPHSIESFSCDPSLHVQLDLGDGTKSLLGPYNAAKMENQS